MPTAPHGNDQVRYCTVTHPFHPLYGTEIQIVSLEQTWGKERVFFRRQDGRLISIPVYWTSSYEPHLFNVISQGRSVFRFKELLELVGLIEEFLSEGEK